MAVWNKEEKYCVSNSKQSDVYDISIVVTFSYARTHTHTHTHTHTYLVEQVVHCHQKVEVIDHFNLVPLCEVLIAHAVELATDAPDQQDTVVHSEAVVVDACVVCVCTYECVHVYVCESSG
jgi:hypothetical protein